MKNRFVVVLDGSASSENVNAVTAFLKESKAGFWHHTSHAWLVVDLNKKLTSAKIRDKLSEIAPSSNNVVIECKPVFWAAYSPEDGHSWMRKNWQVSPDEG